MTPEFLQEAIAQREEEIQHYQVNIDNYTLMLQQLPSVWPDNLAHLKGSDISAVIAQIQDEETIMLVTDLLFRDRLAATLITEKVEQRKAILIRDVLVQQLPAQ